jgi:hypothetical protein
MADARPNYSTGGFNNAPPTPLDYEESASGIDSDFSVAPFEFE